MTGAKADKLRRTIQRGLACLTILSLGNLGCAGAVAYRPRTEQAGIPAEPPTSLESVVATPEHVLQPGVHQPGINRGPYRRPVVTRDGLQEGPEVDSDYVRSIMIAVRTLTTRPVDIVSMNWTAAQAPRCVGGHPSLRLSVDGETRWARPLDLLGEHVVSSRFDEDRPLLESASVVDLLLVEQTEPPQQTCVRVPVTGATSSFSELREWSLGGRFAVRNTLPFLAVGSGGFGPSVGRWLGPLRVGVELLAGQSNEQGQPLVTAQLLNPALELSGIVYRWNHWALGWSAAYELLIASIEETPAAGPKSTRNAVSGGPRLGLRFVSVAPWINSIPRWHARTFWGIEIFTSAAGLAPHGPTDPRHERSPLAWGLSAIVDL